MSNIHVFIHATSRPIDLEDIVPSTRNYMTDPNTRIVSRSVLHKTLEDQSGRTHFVFGGVVKADYDQSELWATELLTQHILKAFGPEHIHTFGEVECTLLTP